MTHPKLRETITRILVLQFAGYDRAVTKAIAPAAEDIEAAVLALPEIADALKWEEDTAIQDWLEDHGHEIHICCWHHTKEGKENEWTIHKGDFDDDNLIGAGKLFRDACRAAMSGGDKK